jgi:hypothetical protein
MLSNLLTYLQGLEQKSTRGIYIRYCLVHSSFIIIDFIFQQEIVDQIVHYLNAHTIFVTAVPLIEHYLLNPFTFACFLIACQFILLPLSIAGTASLFSLVKTGKVKLLFKQNLALATALPLLFLNTYLFLTVGFSSILLSSVFIYLHRSQKRAWLIFAIQTVIHLLIASFPMLLELFFPLAS